MNSLGIPIFLRIGAAGLLLWFLEKHSNNLAKRNNSQIWNFQKIGIPQVPNGWNSRFDGILFCLRKQPGSSAPNRVSSLSILKSDFFRGNLFFHFEYRSEAQRFPLESSEK